MGSSLGRLSVVSPHGDGSTTAPHGLCSRLDFTVRNVLLCLLPPFFPPFLLLFSHIQGRRSEPDRQKGEMILTAAVVFRAAPGAARDTSLLGASGPLPPATARARGSPCALSSTCPTPPGFRGPSGTLPHMYRRLPAFALLALSPSALLQGP